MVIVLNQRHWFILITLLLLAVTVGILFAGSNYSLQGIIVVVAIIVFVVWFLFPYFSRQKKMLISTKVLSLALIARLAFAFVRYWTSFVFYDGSVDAASYHAYGRIFSENIWNLDFSGLASYSEWGTHFIEAFTGTIYAIVGPSIYAGYLVYAFLSFLGSCFFFLAFRTALPDGNNRLAILLFFFFPSILFWSNGIGKDALIFFFLGLFAYGYSIISSRGIIRGILPLSFGILGTLWIRPHIAAISVISFGLAYLFTAFRNKSIKPPTFIAIIVGMVAFLWLVMPQLSVFLNLDQMTSQSIIDRLQIQQGRTVQGGSAYQAIDITNPITYPTAIITILFRPFPWEAHNILAFIQSLEGTLLLGLVVWRIKSLWKAVKSFFCSTYISYALIYTMVFVFIFSIVSNFGIIARERTMLMPFLFVLLCYSFAKSSTRKDY